MDKITGTLQEIGMVQGTLSGVGAVSGSCQFQKGKQLLRLWATITIYLHKKRRR